MYTVVYTYIYILVERVDKLIQSLSKGNLKNAKGRNERTSMGKAKDYLRLYSTMHREIVRETCVSHFL